MIENDLIAPSRYSSRKTNDKLGIGKTIRKLMSDIGIREAELSRKVNLPQTTINRLLLGETTDPRANTLVPLAKFFGISVDQLLGLEPLPPVLVDEGGVSYLQSREKVYYVPLIEWDYIKTWCNEQHFGNGMKKWIITENKLTENAFAINSKPFMKSTFPMGCMLIIDPGRSCSDGSYILIQMNNDITMKRIIIDGAERILQSFDPNIPAVRLQPEFKIYGTLCEYKVQV